MKPRKRRTIRTLAELVGTCPRAPVVWVALLDMAALRGSRCLTPTRDALADATGIRRHKTISRALTALERAGWIRRTCVPILTGSRQTATVLRIVLCRRGRKAPHTERAPVEGAKRPYVRAAVEGAKRPLTPLTGRSGHPSPALDGTGLARKPDTETNPTAASEHPSARIERERLAEIRRVREETEKRQTATRPDGNRK